MLLAATFKIAVNCPACQTRLPVNGIATSTRCDHCGARVPLVWKKLFDLGNPRIHAIDRAIALTPGARDTSAFVSIHLEVTRADAMCPKCNASMSTSELIAHAEKNEPARCGTCQTSIALRKAPPELVAEYPAARAVANEGVVADASAADAKHEPILFPCMGCGAALKVDGSERTVTCEYCKASNYLPDGVWLRLHPPQQMEPFVVLCDIDDVTVFESEYRFGSYEHAERDGKREDLEPARMMALARRGNRALLKNPSCTLEALFELAKCTDYEIRDAASKHPRATKETIARMVATSEACSVGPWEDDECEFDGDWAEIAADPRSTLATLEALAAHGLEDVREALAENPTTTADIIAKLATDKDLDVRIALANRDGLTAAAIAQLARDAEPSVRAVTAARDDLKPEQLIALAHDREDDVLIAVAKNSDTPAEAIAFIVTGGHEEAAAVAKKHPRYKRKWWEIF